MKSVYEWLKNNIRSILQFLLLGGVFFAPRIFKITDLGDKTDIYGWDANP